MKKMYLGASALLMTFTVSAQVQHTIFDMDAPTEWTNNQMTASHDTQSDDRAGGDVFYTHTFDDNFTDFTDVPLSGHAQGAWEWGTTTDPNLVPNWMADISSTTKADGYYWFHGVQYVLGTVDVQNTALTMNNFVDCSTRPGVILEIEQSYRAFNSSSTWIGVSTDGSTWTDYEVNTSVQSNTGTDENIRLNISSIAANQATVYIRFIWNGGTSGGYGWIIDDLTLTEAYANDVSQDNIFAGDIITDFEYYAIPQAQGTNLTVQSALTNNGYNTPTSVQSHVVVTNSAMTVVHDETGGVLSGALAPGDEDTITFTTSLDLSTLTPDVYTITNTIEHSVADDVTSNDELVTEFEITDDIYSHFNPNAASLFFNNPGYNQTGSYDGFQYGVQFVINAAADLHGVDFYVDPGNTGATNYIATSEPQDIGIYVYDATDFQNMVQVGYRVFELDGYTPGMNTFNFHLAQGTSGEVALNAGTLYVIAVETLPGFSLWSVGEGEDEDFSSLMYGPFGSGGTTGWFNNSIEVGMNMNFDASLAGGIGFEENEENPFEIGQNYPNPFDNNSVISYTLNEAADVVITFTDLSGKVINTIDQGSQTTGTYQIEVNANDFAQGVYFYTFNIGEQTITKKMTVK